MSSKNYLEIRHRELKEEIQKLVEDNGRLNVEVCYKSQENIRLKDELTTIGEEIKYYETFTNRSVTIDDTRSEASFLLSKRDKSFNESKLLLKSEQEEFNLDLDPDIKYISQRLDNILNENLRKSNTSMISTNKKEEFESMNLFCNAVLVILYDTERTDEARNETLLLQTFKIDLKTRFKDLKKGVVNFWEIQEKEDFELRFIEESGHLSKIQNEEECLDTFLKGKSNLKKAKFIFCPVSLNHAKLLEKTLSNLEKENKNSEQVNVYTIDSNTENFLTKFVGLTSYLSNKMKQIKRKTMNSGYIPKKATKLDNFLSFLHVIFLLIFVFITLQTLNYKSPPNKSFFMIQTIMNAFQSDEDSLSKNKILTKDLVIDDLLGRLKPMTKDGEYLSNFQPISSLKVSFYRVKNNTNSDRSYYYSTYDYYTTADLETFLLYFEQNSFQSLDIFKGEENLNKFSFYKDENDYIKGSQLESKSLKKMKDYYDDVFQSFHKVNTDAYMSIFYQGNVGIYTGASYDFFISANFANFYTLKTAFDITTKDPFLWDGGLRSLQASISFYHPQSKFFYYVMIVYEFSKEGFVFPVHVWVEPFMPNLYSGTAQTFLYYDYFRLFVTVFMLVLLVRDLIVERNILLDKNPKSGYKDLLLRAKVICEFACILLFWATFIIKMIYLSNKSSPFQFNKSNGWLQVVSKDYFIISSFYKIDTIIEAIIFSFAFFRIAILFLSFKRVRSFSHFLVHSFRNIISFLLIILGILFSFCVFANNLFGQDNSEFMHINGSFIKMLLFSIGHFPLYVDFKKNALWVSIFFLSFLVIFVYFFLNTFSGMFLESFRIVSTRKGYSYDNKNQDSEKLLNYIKKFKGKTATTGPKSVEIK